MAVIRADHATVSLGFIQSKAFARDPVSVPIEPMRVAEPAFITIWVLCTIAWVIVALVRLTTRESEFDHRRLQVPSSPLHEPSADELPPAQGRQRVTPPGLDKGHQSPLTQLGHQRRADPSWPTTTNGAQNIRAGGGTVVKFLQNWMRSGERRVSIDSLANCSQNRFDARDWRALYRGEYP